MNIACAIGYDHKISRGIDENDTIPYRSQGSLLSFKIPVEMATGMLIIIGVVLAVAMGVAVTQKRESNST